LLKGVKFSRQCARQPAQGELDLRQRPAKKFNPKAGGELDSRPLEAEHLRRIGA
jgi:hypothetical protein